MKIIFYTLFSMILINCKAQTSKKMENTNNNIDITKEMPVEKFKNIVDFILKRGDRETYCNKYNNNPHYKLEGFDIYLNPLDWRINHSKDSLSNNIADYNSIVIRDYNTDIQYQYYDIELFKNKVYLYEPHDNLSASEFDFLKKAFLRIYLPKIVTEIYLKNKQQL